MYCEPTPACSRGRRAALAGRTRPLPFLTAVWLLALGFAAAYSATALPMPEFPTGDERAAVQDEESAKGAAAERPRSSRRILDSVDPEELVRALDADRLLLIELRKDVPEARVEAENYLARLKLLAQQCDPVRLVPLLKRVLDQAPIYFQWLERDFEDNDERMMEYYVGGARGFSFALDNFRAAALLTVINRLEIASRVITELHRELRP